MKFRTEINITPFKSKIDYSSSILSIGSCFASSIGAELDRVRFQSCVNPLGVLFNPISIASTLNRLHLNKKITAEELNLSCNGVWFHYDMHGSLSGQTPEEATSKMCNAIEEGHKAIMGADWVIITLGSAWVYRHKTSGDVVANCHKQPAKEFNRELLSVDEITSSLDGLMQGVLRGKNVIFTLSPIRHTADGLEQNSLSKATLRVGIESIVNSYDSAHYFPSYEILVDDLRDYRFYAEDMVHPSKSAIDYIWQLFTQSAISGESEQKIRQVEKVIRSSEHRPLRRHSSEYATFCRRNIELLDNIKGVDLTREREHFTHELAQIDKK